MGLDIYFNLADAGLTERPEVDFNLPNWSGNDKIYTAFVFPENTPLKTLLYEEMLDRALVGETYTVTENIVSLDSCYGIPTSCIDGSDNPLWHNVKPIMHVDKTFASYRGGRVALLVEMLSGISLYQDTCTPEQVKLIAASLSANEYDYDWLDGVYDFTKYVPLSSERVEQSLSNRTYGGLLGSGGQLVGNRVLTRSSSITPQLYEELKKCYWFYADLGCGSYQDW